MLRIHRDRPVPSSAKPQNGFLDWVRQSLSLVNYDLSDPTCRIKVSDHFEQGQYTLTIKACFEPLQGQFQDHCFRAQVMFDYMNILAKPRVYNHQRVYHPNISVCTGQIIVPDLVKAWNPAYFLHIFYGIRKILLEPDANYVPNTQLNKQAGWNYDKNRHKYKALMSYYTSEMLESEFVSQADWHQQNGMDEELSEGQERKDVCSVYQMLARPEISEMLDDEEEEEDTLMFSKQIRPYYSEDSTNMSIQEE